jgi:hypothetical protein
VTAARSGLGAVSLLLVATLPLDAAAFCRSSTCDPRVDDCVIEDGCNVSGVPLFWPSDCVSFVVHEDGSDAHGISANALSGAARRAFDSWSSADCDGGGQPSIGAEDLGAIACDKSEYEATVSNANLIVIREDWPYPGGDMVVGLTMVRFNTKTGSIRDADIEVNGDDFALSVGDPVEDSDLEAILTHEIGHFLGLDHSLEPGATMLRDYPVSNDSGRSLADDDVAGICKVYPPDRRVESTNCAPVNGLSGECADEQEPLPDDANEESGCHVSPRNGRARPSWIFALLGAAWLVRRRALRNAR